MRCLVPAALALSLASACGPPAESTPDDLVVDVGRDGSLAIAGEELWRPGDSTAAFSRALYESTRAMVELVDDQGLSLLVPNGTVVVRGRPEAGFAGVVQAVEACRYKGIDVWKVDFVLGDEEGEERGRLGLRLPMDIGISCTLHDFSLLHAILAKTSGGETIAVFWRESWTEHQQPPTGADRAEAPPGSLLRLLDESSAEQQDGSVERALVIELPAAELAGLSSDSLDTESVIVTADSTATWGEVFPILQALRARGVFHFTLRAR